VRKPCSDIRLRSWQDTFATFARGRWASRSSDKPRHVGKRAWHQLSPPVLGIFTQGLLQLLRRGDQPEPGSWLELYRNDIDARMLKVPTLEQRHCILEETP
jgi:hypothetical protein